MNEFNYEGWVYGNISESAPADSSSAGHAGQIAIDSDYIYVWVYIGYKNGRLCSCERLRNMSQTLLLGRVFYYIFKVNLRVIYYEYN